MRLILLFLNCFKAYVGRLLMKETPYKGCHANEEKSNDCQKKYNFVWDDGTVLDKIIPVRYEFEDGAYCFYGYPVKPVNRFSLENHDHE